MQKENLKPGLHFVKYAQPNRNDFYIVIVAPNGKEVWRSAQMYTRKSGAKDGWISLLTFLKTNPGYFMFKHEQRDMPDVLPAGFIISETGKNSWSAMVHISNGRTLFRTCDVFTRSRSALAAVDFLKKFCAQNTFPTHMTTVFAESSKKKAKRK